MLQANPSHLA